MVVDFIVVNLEELSMLACWIGILELDCSVSLKCEPCRGGVVLGFEVLDCERTMF